MDRLALTPGRKMQEPPLVDSTNLIGYLGHNPYFNDPRLKFAPELDLKWCSRFVKQVDQAQAVKDFVESDSLRAKLVASQENKKRRQGKKYLPTTKLFFEVVSHINQIDPKDPFRQESAERYKLVYWDFDKQSAAASRVIYGKYGSVGGALETIGAAVDAGKKPLLDIHSHPDVSLFSSPDYREMSLLHPLVEHPSSLVRGAIVVCPGEQILALATPQTPLKTWKDTLAWLDFTQVDLSRTYESRNKKFDVALEKWIERFASKVLKLHDQYLGFEKMLDELEVPDNQWRAIYKRDHDKTKAFLMDSLIIYLGIGRGFSEFTESRNNHLMNEHKQGLYRELNLKMYRSTDMRHFKEFSA